MLFSELLKCAELHPTRAGGDAEVDNVQVDSRLCRAGSCFVAVRGWRDDGHRHISGAIERGASAIVCELRGAGDGASAWAETADSHDALGRVVDKHITGAHRDTIEAMALGKVVLNVCQAGKAFLWGLDMPMGLGDEVATVVND